MNAPVLGFCIKLPCDLAGAFPTGTEAENPLIVGGGKVFYQLHVP